LQANITQHPQQLAGETFTRTVPTQPTWQPLAATSEITSLENYPPQPAGAGESERTLAPFMQSWGDSVGQSAGDFLPPAAGNQLVSSASAETASFVWEELPTNQSHAAQEVSTSWTKAVQELAPYVDDDKASSVCTSSITILAPRLSLPERCLEDASSIIETEVLDGSFVAADMFAEHNCSHLKHGADTPSTVPSYPAPLETCNPAPLETCSPRSPISPHSNPSFSSSGLMDTHASCPQPQHDPLRPMHDAEVCNIGQLQAEASALQVKALNLQTWINRLAHERCGHQNALYKCHNEAAGGA